MQGKDQLLPSCFLKKVNRVEDPGVSLDHSNGGAYPLQEGRSMGSLSHGLVSVFLEVPDDRKIHAA